MSSNLEIRRLPANRQRSLHWQVAKELALEILDGSHVADGDHPGGCDLQFSHHAADATAFSGYHHNLSSHCAFKTFDIIFVLTGGGPGITTGSLNLLAYNHGIKFLSMGYAAAITIFMPIVTIRLRILAGVYQSHSSRRETRYRLSSVA